MSRQTLGSVGGVSGSVLSHWGAHPLAFVSTIINIITSSSWTYDTIFVALTAASVIISEFYNRSGAAPGRRLDRSTSQSIGRSPLTRSIPDVKALRHDPRHAQQASLKFIQDCWCWTAHYCGLFLREMCVFWWPGGVRKLVRKTRTFISAQVSLIIRLPPRWILPLLMNLST